MRTARDVVCDSLDAHSAIGRDPPGAVATYTTVPSNARSRDVRRSGSCPSARAPSRTCSGIERPTRCQGRAPPPPKRDAVFTFAALAAAMFAAFAHRALRGRYRRSRRSEVCGGASASARTATTRPTIVWALRLATRGDRGRGRRRAFAVAGLRAARIATQPARGSVSHGRERRCAAAAVADLRRHSALRPSRYVTPLGFAAGLANALVRRCRSRAPRRRHRRRTPDL